MSSRLVVLFSVLPLRALAWDSVCFEANGKSCSPSAGPQTARQRCIRPSDEHRQLFEQTREGQVLKWVPPVELSRYPMPPADLPLVGLLRDLL